MSQNDKSYENDDYYALIEDYYMPKKLSVEQLRKYNGFENIDNETAIEIIDGLWNLSIIICKTKKQKI